MKLRKFLIPMICLLIGATVGLYGLHSADYTRGTLGTAGPIGSPILLYRVDNPADDAGANLAYGRLSADLGGSMRVSTEGGKPTYAATSQFACDSTGTDIAVFPGTASKTVKILKIFVSSTATAAATGDIAIIRRSTADTAGTTGNASVGKLNSGNAAAFSQPVHYTAHPTALGTAVATLYCERFVQQAAGTPQASKTEINLQNFFGAQALRLKGSSDFIALNVAAALGGSGNAWDVTWVFTEDAAGNE